MTGTAPPIKRRCKDQQEDCRDVLENEDRRRGERDGAALLTPLGDHSNHDRRRGQGERRADDDASDGCVAEGKGAATEEQRRCRDLERSEAEDVGGLLPHMRDGEVEADVEEEEDDAEIGEQVDGAVCGEQVGPNGRDRRAEDEIADDRADACQARQDCGDDPGCKQDQDRNDRICNFHEVPD
jgi:hypothetical protein